MFTPKPKTELEKTITKVHLEMSNHDCDSEAFAQMGDQLVKLYPLKNQNRISPDVLIPAIVNIAGILIIVSYERTHVVVSKALQFVLKTKI